MQQGILVLNAGSSSLKFALYRQQDHQSDLSSLLHGQVAGIGRKPSFQAFDNQGHSLQSGDGSSALPVTNHLDAITLVLNWVHQQVSDIEVTAVGHRVVHGGHDRHKPEIITDESITQLKKLCPLAPLHQPHNLSAIEAVREMDPSMLQVACFDTAFHAQQPAVARRLPLPRRFQEKGLMRYGFHGLSYEYITSALPEYNDGALPPRLVVAHLGNGASLCAVRQGVGIATTMGFSTLDGVMMGTRSGSLDPGVLLYLMSEEKMDHQSLSDMVYHQCGLLGLSDISSDMQVLLNSQHELAQQAVESFCYSIQQSIGSLVAVLEGMDGLVFTGGIGEHAAEVRARICKTLKWMGLELDPARNDQHGPLITTDNSAIPVWVIPTDEELVIARHSLAAIQQQS